MAAGIMAISLLVSSLDGLLYLVFPPAIFLSILTNLSFVISGIMLFASWKDGAGEGWTEKERKGSARAGLVLMAVAIVLVALTPFVFALGAGSRPFAIAGAYVGLLGYSLKGICAGIFCRGVVPRKRWPIAAAGIAMVSIALVVMGILVFSPLSDTADKMVSVGSSAPSAQQLADWIAPPLVKFLDFKFLYTPGYVLIGGALLAFALGPAPEREKAKPIELAGSDGAEGKTEAVKKGKDEGWE